MKLYAPLLLILLLIFSSCKDSSFSVKGTVSGADGKSLVLEKADHTGQWIALDSVKLNDGGKFSFSQHSPAAPEIYRLSLDNNYIYFPIDSLDNLKISANASNFATDFNIEGSENAVNMAAFEKQLIAAAPILTIPDSAAAFKRRIFTQYLQNAKGSIISYYILTKTVDGNPLFDQADDARYIAAVATGFRQFRPSDPRCRLLEQIATEALKKNSEKKGNKRVFQAEEIGYLPISLPDENGKETTLSDIAGKGVPTILVFEEMAAEKTPELNRQLTQLSESGKVKIYSVGLDSDQLIWRNAAAKLPFTTVFANLSNAQSICADYRIDSLPTLFLIDANGSLITRASNLASIKKSI